MKQDVDAVPLYKQSCDGALERCSLTYRKGVGEVLCAPATFVSGRALPAFVTAAFVVALLAGAQPADARVRNCEIVDGSVAAVVTSARNMTCRAAARDIRRSKYRTHERTVGGFRCASTGRPYFWRCTKGRQAYRWNYFE